MSIVIDLREYEKGGKETKEALNTALKMRKTGAYSDDELQKMYDERVKKGKEKDEQ